LVFNNYNIFIKKFNINIRLILKEMTKDLKFTKTKTNVLATKITK